jgi:hypothetical protein
LPDPEGDVDPVGDREPVDCLEDERETQSLLQLDYDGSFVASHRDDVAGPDLALHAVALALQEALDRGVEFDFWTGQRFTTPLVARLYATARPVGRAGS